MIHIVIEMNLTDMMPNKKVRYKNIHSEYTPQVHGIQKEEKQNNGSLRDAS